MVQVPLIEPAEIILPTGSQEITFVSRFDTSQISFTKKKASTVYKESYIAFISGLKEGFESIDHLQLSIPDTLIPGQWYTNKTPKFEDSTKVLQMITKFQPNYVLTLDAFKLEITKEDEVIDYGGTLVHSTNYFVDGSAALALFNENGQTIDKMMMNNQYFIDNTYGGNLSSGSDIGSYGDFAGPLTYDLGYDYALMFIPFKSFVSRYMYGGKHFKEVLDLAKKDNWTDARTKLLPLTESPDQKIASKAVFNMVVVSEALGDPQEVNKWQQRVASPN